MRKNANEDDWMFNDAKKFEASDHKSGFSQLSQ